MNTCKFCSVLFFYAYTGCPEVPSTLNYSAIFKDIYILFPQYDIERSYMVSQLRRPDQTFFFFFMERPICFYTFISVFKKKQAFVKKHIVCSKFFGTLNKEICAFWTVAATNIIVCNYTTAFI